RPRSAVRCGSLVAARGPRELAVFLNEDMHPFDMIYTTLRTFFREAELAKRATNWFNVSFQAYKNRFMAHDYCQRHPNAYARHRQAAGQVPDVFIGDHSGSSRSLQLSQLEPLWRLL